MITRRDQDLFNFLDEFHIATTSQLKRLFFVNTSARYCRKRLQYLFEQGYIKRVKSTISNDYAYYTDRKSVSIAQVHHDLLRVELYIGIKERYKILEWRNETPIKDIRPDAIAYINNSNFAFINDHDIIFPVFLEIHLSNKFNFEKYKTLVKQADLRIIMGGLMPRVVICTDRQITIPPGIGLKFKIVDFSMKGLDALFK